MIDPNATSDETKPAPKWKPINAVHRRILGVLGEKAKTTTDQYPLSLNALTNGCNQKSNRSPQMNLEPIQVEDGLEKLRAIAAVSEVQGSGRVAKFKHHIYEWLGVDKVESAVMIELLLRGAQTVGELRGRAARMEPIADAAALRPILRALIDRGLVMAMTPEGRGQIVTHALYLDQEMDKLRNQVRAHAEIATADASSRPGLATPEPTPTSSPPAATSCASPTSQLEDLGREVQELRSEVAKLRNDVEDIWKNLGN